MAFRASRELLGTWQRYDLHTALNQLYQVYLLKIGTYLSNVEVR